MQLYDYENQRVTHLTFSESLESLQFKVHEQKKKRKKTVKKNPQNRTNLNHAAARQLHKRI